MRRVCSDLGTLRHLCFGFLFAVILACNRSDLYFYVYYVANIVAGIFCGGNMHCLCLAYVVKKYKLQKQKNTSFITAKKRRTYNTVK